MLTGFKPITDAVLFRSALMYLIYALGLVHERIDV